MCASTCLTAIISACPLRAVVNNEFNRNETVLRDEIKERREMGERTIVHRGAPQGSEDVVVDRASQVSPCTDGTETERRADCRSTLSPTK